MDINVYMAHINNLIKHNNEYAKKHTQMENVIVQLKEEISNFENVITQIKQELNHLKEDNNNQLNIINNLQNNMQDNNQNL